MKKRITDTYCSYYQAYIPPKEVLFLVSILKSFDHLAFDRALDVEKSLFEFFVPIDQEELFEALMKSLEKRGVVENLTKLPNRMINES